MLHSQRLSYYEWQQRAHQVYRFLHTRARFGMIAFLTSKRAPEKVPFVIASTANQLMQLLLLLV